MNPVKALALDLWHRFATWIPVLIMSLLAIGTWWLIRSAPSLFANTPVQTERSLPDFYLWGFSSQNFDASGQLIRELSGTKAWHIPHDDSTHIKGIELRARQVSPDDSQRQTWAEADKGIVFGHGDDITLSGRVKILSQTQGEPDLTLRTERLRAHTDDQGQQWLESDVPVHVQRGAWTIQAQGMRYNTERRQLEFSGQVKSVVPARTLANP